MTTPIVAALLQQELKQQQGNLETQQVDDRAALIQLEAQVINAACDNPGLLVTYKLFLPMVRERLMLKLPQSVQDKHAQPQRQVHPHLLTLLQPLCLALVRIHS